MLRILSIQFNPLNIIISLASNVGVQMDRSSQYFTLSVLDNINTIVYRCLVRASETAVYTKTNVCINRFFANCSNTIRNSKVLQLNEQRIS